MVMVMVSLSVGIPMARVMEKTPVLMLMEIVQVVEELVHLGLLHQSAEVF